MKKAILFPMIIAFMLFAGFSAQAQDGKMENTEEKAERMTKKMTKDLELNADQTERVRVVNRNFAERKEALKQKNKDRENYSEANDEEMRKLKESRRAELKNILSDAQYRKHLDQEKNEGDMHKHDMKDGSGSTKDKY